MSKKIQLVERDAQGRIRKNESYHFNQMKRIVISKNYDYFNNFLWGKIRRNALSLVFDTFWRMITMDQEGKGSPTFKENE